MNFTMLLSSIWHFAHRKTSALLISAILNLVSNRINRSRTAVHSVYDRKTGLVQTNGNGSWTFKPVAWFVPSEWAIVYVNFKEYGCCGIKDEDQFLHDCPILNSKERLVITAMFKLQTALYNERVLIHMYTTINSLLLH